MRKVLIFANTMCPIIALTRIRRIYANCCSPPYLGFAFGYCTGCGMLVTEGIYLSPAWKLIKILVMFADGYHIAVKVFKSFFLLFNVTLLANGCVLDYLDLLERSPMFLDNYYNGVSQRMLADFDQTCVNRLEI